MDKKVNGHAAVILANVIFGLGVPITKYLLGEWVTPMVYMALRCIGAALIFWLIAAFLPKEKVERKDLIVIMLGGLTGFVISQTLTAWSLNYTSPVYYSLIATLVPIGTMLLAAVFLKEGITGIKLLGVFLGIAGAALLVLVKWQTEAGSNDLLGIFLALLSLLTWVIYLIITSKVSAKYSAVTQMKWTFLVSTIAVLPFAWSEFGETKLFSGDYGRTDGCGRYGIHRDLRHSAWLLHDSLRHEISSCHYGEHLHQPATHCGFAGCHRHWPRLLHLGQTRRCRIGTIGCISGDTEKQLKF